MQAEYYFVVNGQQQGPFPKEELRKYNISPDTLVWRAGMTNWVKATELPELADLFAINVDVVDNPSNFQTDENVSQDTSDNNWFAMFAGNRFGPTSISALIANGLTRDTPVWHPGMNDWQPAYTQTEVMTALNQVPPTGNSYGQHPLTRSQTGSQIIRNMGNRILTGMALRLPTVIRNMGNPLTTSRISRQIHNIIPGKPTGKIMVSKITGNRIMVRITGSRIRISSATLPPTPIGCLWQLLPRYSDSYALA